MAPPKRRMDTVADVKLCESLQVFLQRETDRITHAFSQQPSEKSGMGPGAWATGVLI